MASSNLLGTAAKAFAYLIGSLATVTGFIFAVLGILKDHLGVDTHAMLLRLGTTLGSDLVRFQVDFSDLVRALNVALGGGTKTLLLVGMLVALTFAMTAIFFVIRARRQALMYVRERYRSRADESEKPINFA
jgi:hypothetical protein